MWRARSVTAHGMEAKPNMVGGPAPFRVAERGAQQFDDLPHDLAAQRLGKLVEEGAAESPEPSLHAGLEKRRTRDEHDLFDAEAAFGEEAGIFFRRGKEPGRGDGRITAAERSDRADGGRDRRDIAMAAKLAHEAAAGAKGAREPSITNFGFRIQWSAALENTASNSETKSNA